MARSRALRPTAPPFLRPREQAFLIRAFLSGAFLSGADPTAACALIRARARLLARLARDRERSRGPQRPKSH